MTNQINYRNLPDYPKVAGLPAIILAAGQGKRLRPYTNEIPKPLAKIDGKPILEYVLMGLIKTGIRHFFIITGYKEELIREWIQDEFCVKAYRDYSKILNLNREPLGFSFIHQDQINGTGGAALLAEDHIKENNYSHFLLTYGDLLVSSDVYIRLVKSYLDDAFEKKKSNSELKSKIYLVGNYTEDPSAGAAIYYEGDKIVNFIEKPPKDAPKTDLNNAGIYIFNSEIFTDLHSTPLSTRGEIELTAPIIDRVRQNEVIHLVKMEQNEFWCDVGTVEVFEELNKNLGWLAKL